MTARLGDAAATIAAFMGLWAWGRLEPARKAITVFCLLSAALGIWQAALAAAHVGSAIPGNLWDLLLLGLFLPALLMFVRKPLRGPFIPLAVGVGTVWVMAHLWFGGMDQFNDAVSMAIYMLLALCGAVLLFQNLDEAGSLLTQPHSLRAIAVFAALMVDALNSLVLINGAAVGPGFCVIIMTLRNLIWIAAYLALGFSLWFPQQRGKDRRAGGLSRRRGDRPEPTLDNIHLYGGVRGRV